MNGTHRRVARAASHRNQPSHRDEPGTGLSARPLLPADAEDERRKDRSHQGLKDLTRRRSLS